MEVIPSSTASQNIPNVPYHRFAELIGLKGIFVDRPDALGSSWDEALAADRPVVLEVKTDPEVPPLPPHITFKQASHLPRCLLDHAASRGIACQQSLGQVRGLFEGDVRR